MILSALAERADRSLRTFSARRTTEETYETLQPFVRAGEEALLGALASLRAWSRPEPSRFVCAFGERTANVTLPIPFNPYALLRLIIRTEVNVFLGDSDPVLLPMLQSIAQRELERLLARDRAE
jgi:hypothetical protein